MLTVIQANTGLLARPTSDHLPIFFVDKRIAFIVFFKPLWISSREGLRLRWSPCSTTSHRTVAVGLRFPSYEKSHKFSVTKDFCLCRCEPTTHRLVFWCPLQRLLIGQDTPCYRRCATSRPEILAPILLLPLLQADQNCESVRQQRLQFA